MKMKRLLLVETALCLGLSLFVTGCGKVTARVSENVEWQQR
jgi:hypothetical protein